MSIVKVTYRDTIYQSYVVLNTICILMIPTWQQSSDLQGTSLSPNDNHHYIIDIFTINIAVTIIHTNTDMCSSHITQHMNIAITMLYTQSSN